MILKAPAEELLAPADPIEMDVEGFAEAQRIVDVLIREADAWESAGYGGVAGLAAPQIGVSKRVFILKKGGAWKAYVNPVITRFSPKENVAVEGCLSIPGVSYAVRRPVSIRAEWFTPSGGQEMGAFGVPLARAFQHEYDHLDGVLISERGEVAQIRTA